VQTGEPPASFYRPLPLLLLLLQHLGGVAVPDGYHRNTMYHVEKIRTVCVNDIPDSQTATHGWDLTDKFFKIWINLGPSATCNQGKNLTKYVLSNSTVVLFSRDPPKSGAPVKLPPLKTILRIS